MMTRKGGSAQDRRYRLGPRLTRPMMARSLAGRIGYFNLGDLIDSKRPIGFERLLGSRVVRLDFQPGDRVYPSIRFDPALLILEQGSLNVFLDDEPDRLLIKRVEPETVLGELPAFGLSMFGAVTEAATAARVMAIGMDGVEMLEARSLPFRRGWRRVVGPRFVQSESQSVLCRFGSVPTRVVHELLLLADGRLVIQITQQELADRVGLGRVSVSIALRELERERIIAIHRGSIEIEDLERLRDLALF
jgi:CRP/FNR family cyclic AMP-dependent transcriptional regulator